MGLMSVGLFTSVHSSHEVCASIHHLFDSPDLPDLHLYLVRRYHHRKNGRLSQSFSFGAPEPIYQAYTAW